MGLFGSKKKGQDQMRTLSEKEIQAKLYGSYRMIQDGRRAEPSNTPPRRVTPLEKNFDNERLSTLAEWVDEEAETTAKAIQLGWQQERKATREHKRPRAPRPSVLRPVLQSLAGKVVDFLRSLDWQRVETRGMGYWIGAAALLGLMFAGIHFLNERREATMKSPPKVERTLTASGVEKNEAAKASLPPAQETPSSPLRTPPEAQAPPAEPPAPPSLREAEGRYAIQVCTYASQGDAERLVARLQNENFTAFVKDLRRSATGKVYYAVFAGRFKDYDEAKTALANFQKKEISKPFQDAFIRTLS